MARKPLGKKEAAGPRWRVTCIVGAKAQEICELNAETAEAAIKLAVRQHAIEPERRKRLAAYRVR